MLNQKALEYVDEVMSVIIAPDRYKATFRKELIRHFKEASEISDIDEIIYKLGSPERLADEMSQSLEKRIGKDVDSIFSGSEEENIRFSQIPGKSYDEYALMGKYNKSMPQKYHGEITEEESDVNISVLYIPLVQISSDVVKRRWFF